MLNFKFPIDFDLIIEPRDDDGVALRVFNADKFSCDFLSLKKEKIKQNLKVIK